jgi:hypothetical protein
MMNSPGLQAGGQKPKRPVLSTIRHPPGGGWWKGIRVCSDPQAKAWGYLSGNSGKFNIVEVITREVFMELECKSEAFAVKVLL